MEIISSGSAYKKVPNLELSSMWSGRSLGRKHSYLLRDRLLKNLMDPHLLIASYRVICIAFVSKLKSELSSEESENFSWKYPEP